MVEIRKGLRYATHDGVELHGDLYLPDGPGPHPVLVGVPGGGWRRGDRSGFRIWGEHLAANSFALFSVDHRKSNDGPIFPQNVQDVLAAVRFIHARAEELSLDRERLGVLGSSAGAHLGALVSLAGHKSLFADGYPDDEGASARPDIKVLVAVYGVYDLVTHWQADLDNNSADNEDFTERFLGKTPYDDQQLYFDASPIRHVAYAANAPKALVIWGTQDREVRPVQSEMFARALKQARFFVRTLPVEGAGHFWFSEDSVEDPRGFNSLVAPRLVRFLRQHLGGAQTHGGG